MNYLLRFSPALFLPEENFPDMFLRLGKLSFIGKENFPAEDDNFPSYERKAVKLFASVSLTNFKHSSCIFSPDIQRIIWLV